MTNEESKATTSSFLSRSEKHQNLSNNLKKKRGILDIDALWRKKLQSQKTDCLKENGKTQIAQNSSTTTTSTSTTTTTLSNRNIAKDQKEFKSKTRRKMEASVKDVLSGKRTAPVSFQCSTIDDGLVVGGEDMETLRSNSSDIVTPTTTPRTSSQYDFPTLEYPTSVTPASYTLYAADNTNYANYYQYSANMQPSPQDSGYICANVHGNNQQAAHSPLSIDDNDVNGLGHATRASPATIQWLTDNYEIADGTSLPRCTLYDHYKKHCTEHRLDPVNAASFGKLIRSVFQGLRTRRLGTRGNSKYHYYGIRIKPESTLNRSGHHGQTTYNCSADSYSDIVNSVADVKYSVPPPNKRMKTHSSSSSSCRDSASPVMNIPIQQPMLTVQTPPQETKTPQQPAAAPTVQESKALINLGDSQVNSVQAPQSQDIYNAYFTAEDRSSLGDVEMPQIPFQNTLNIETSLRKLGLAIDHIEKFVNCYHFMCKEILAHVKKLEFEAVEDCWVTFWRGNEYTITRDELLSICTLEDVQDYMIELDLTLYQSIVDCIIPNVLMSQLSARLVQSSRTFAKNVDLYLKKALQTCGVSENLMKKKMQAIKYMQQGLKRYTSLNHLAQAARAVLQKHDQVLQMYNDYVRVDMNQVHEQAGWICGCDTMMVQHVNAAFKQNLEKMAPMEEWAEWLESIVDQVLAKYHDKPAEAIANVGKQFLLNWSFYTSMIIRDLTLRSATSFGSFHLIRLLADDFMYYLIESKIARAGKQQLITVIRTDKDYPLFNENHEYIIPSSDDCSNNSSDNLLLEEADILSI